MKQKTKDMLKSKLDRVFSTYIRLRDANESGYVRCYCCGKFLFWKESQNMHFIPRQHMGTRFDEVNCNAGCIKCNFYNNGNIEAYTLHLVRDHGEGIVERLTLKKMIGRKFSDFEYKELIRHYNNEIDRQVKENGSNTDNFSQVVNSNLPEKFTIQVPLFRGMPAETIEVETFAKINGREVAFILLSPGANQIVEEVRDNIIKDQIVKIHMAAPDIVIIEV